MLRRICLLGRIHCESDWNLPYKDIFDQAVNHFKLVIAIPRGTTGSAIPIQRTRMNIGGIIGTLNYAGDLAPFMPLIMLGQFTHIRKNTTFGLGKYVVERGE